MNNSCVNLYNKMDVKNLNNVNEILIFQKLKWLIFLIYLVRNVKMLIFALNLKCYEIPFY